MHKPDLSMFGEPVACPAAKDSPGSAEIQKTRIKTVRHHRWHLLNCKTEIRSLRWVRWISLNIPLGDNHGCWRIDGTRLKFHLSMACCVFRWFDTPGSGNRCKTGKNGSRCRGAFWSAVSCTFAARTPLSRQSEQIASVVRYHPPQSLLVVL